MCPDVVVEQGVPGGRFRPVRGRICKPIQVPHDPWIEIAERISSCSRSPKLVEPSEVRVGIVGDRGQGDRRWGQAGREVADCDKDSL